MSSAQFDRICLLHIASPQFQFLKPITRSHSAHSPPAQPTHHFRFPVTSSPKAPRPPSSMVARDHWAESAVPNLYTAPCPTRSSGSRVAACPSARVFCFVGGRACWWTSSQPTTTLPAGRSCVYIYIYTNTKKKKRSTKHIQQPPPHAPLSSRAESTRSCVRMPLATSSRASGVSA